ncbi:DUF6457 domain-containing protein [Jatrophihabitans sp.]|uniref:DUF6457 domain-containing protein n=1 Tax=Jatrophihabitans sp. TaxID=1932789 RepID=UPI0030C77728|nr:molybdenum cofactor guanylyltransferase [Jatrophihabitans sp.]
MPDADHDHELDRWLHEVCAALGLPPELAAHRQLLLDVARDAAHGVMRPAAPLTTFLVGYAAGRSAGDAAAVEEAAEVASALARHREHPE